MKKVINKKIIILLSLLLFLPLFSGCFSVPSTKVAVTGVTLDQTTMALTAGGATGRLVETVVPADATDKTVTWSSNNAAATVAAGVVTGVSAGTAIITVTTVDGSKTATCTVTVTAAAPLAVGDSYGGGIVAYILVSTDPGYSASVQHGLIAATADINTTYTDGWGAGSLTGFYRWSTGQKTTVNTTDYTYQSISTGTDIGSGLSNTTAILAKWDAATYPNTAAAVARAYTDGTYSDWFLPSKDELNKLYINKDKIGGFAGSYCWSSSEDKDTIFTTFFYNAWTQYFESGNQWSHNKDQAFSVRAVRTF